MTEKEMIEEMAKCYCDYCMAQTGEKECEKQADKSCSVFWDCEFFYKAGYRKIPEGAVVLTEDNAEDVANMILNSSQLKETMDRLIKDWQKETAMEFGNFVKSKLFDLGNIVNESDIDDMLKEFCDEN